MGELERGAGLFELPDRIRPKILSSDSARGRAHDSRIEQDAAVPHRPVCEVVTGPELVTETLRAVRVEVYVFGQIADVGAGSDDVVVQVAYPCPARAGCRSREDQGFRAELTAASLDGGGDCEE